MLLKRCIQYVNKCGKLSTGHRIRKDQFSFQSQRAMPKWKSLSCVQLFVTSMDYKVHGILQARILVWVIKAFFVQFCVFLPRLNLLCFSWVFTVSILYCAYFCIKRSLGIWLSWRGFSFFPLYCFLLFHCIVHLRRLSYLSQLFFESLHSVGYILPFLLWISFLFFLSLL